MILAVYDILNAQKRFEAVANMLERIKSGNKVQVDTDTMFSNINAAFIDLFHSFKVLSYANASMPVTYGMIPDMVDMLYDQYKDLRADEERELTDYLPVVSRLDKLLASLKDEYNFRTMSVYRLSKDNLAEDWRYGYAGLSLNAYDRILESVINYHRPMNVLDLNCYQGKGLLRIKELNPQAELYGVSILNNFTLSSDDRDKFARFLTGGLDGVKAENSVFDIAFVTPMISMERDPDKKNFKPVERTYLDRAFNYLRRDGLMVFAIPSFFISKTVATFIAKNLKNVSLFKDTEYSHDHDVIVIMGKKKDPLSRELDPHLFAVLRNLCRQPKLIEEYPLQAYDIPKGMLTINKFRGGTINDLEISMIYSASNAVKDFWKKQKVVKLSDKAVHPLLPFTVGQLGLVLTSGCLDGIIEEPDNCAHVVKGRVVKVMDTKREFDEEGEKVNVITTTSNRVEISMFLPDGSYKCLC
jgi:hypothetical protein